jgi:hypothetical protein
VPDSSIAERVKFLRQRVSRIRDANRAYLDRRRHLPADVEAHKRRAGKLRDTG